MARLHSSAHTEQPWRIHELTRDLRLEDVWAIHTPGAGPDDLPAVLAAITGPAAGPEPWPVRFLSAVRMRLGAALGWDDPATGVGARVPSLRDRLPDDLRDTPDPSGELPFAPLYALDREIARELANKTVHAVLHLGWVPTADGGHELRLAVLVKPSGLFGRAYMAAIAPFRYLIVYPAMIRRWEQAWRNHTTNR